MHSDDSTQSSFVNDPRQAVANEAWRTEVASRVCSYRARRKSGNAGANSPSLDFNPASGAQTLGTKSFAAQSPSAQNAVSPNISSGSHAGGQAASSRVASPGAEARNPARNAFDTNYYRRLNAAAMAQSSSILLGATVAAPAPAQEHEAEIAVESEPKSERESDDSLRDLLLSDTICDPASSVEHPALDLEIRPAVAPDSSLDRYCISAPPLPEPERETPAAPSQGNLIVFPRSLLEPPLLPQPSRDELAEPMHRRPRILEVPEDIMPVVQGSLFPEIRLDGDVEEGASSPEPEIESLLQVAPVSARLMAGLTDLGVVITAGVLFAGIAFRALPGIPHAKPFWMGLGVVTLLLWAVYQQLFLLYAGRTVGMSMRGIRLSTFDGRTPQWMQRRRRARFMFISFAAVALGFLWALVDEDALCWHDRISRTFPTLQ